MFFTNRKKRKEKKLNEIQRTIDSYNEQLLHINNELDKSYKARNKIKDELENYYDRYNTCKTCKFYFSICPIKSYYGEKIIAEEKEQSRIDEEIIYFKQQMYNIQNRIDKLCEENKNILNKMGDDK